MECIFSKGTTPEFTSLLALVVFLAESQTVFYRSGP